MMLTNHMHKILALDEKRKLSQLIQNYFNDHETQVSQETYTSKGLCHIL